MNKNTNALSKSQAINLVASQMTGPMDVDEFYRQVLTLSPSQAKNPKAGIQQALRFDFLGKTLIYQEDRTLIPIRLAMPGVRFRANLSRQEIEKGWLFVLPAFQYMASANLPPEDYWLEEADGHSIPVNLVKGKSRIKTIFGPEDFEQTAFDLGWWYKKHALRRGDSILITVLDWERGRFRLEPESARIRQRHKDEIQQQNQLLADHIYQQLENEKTEDIWGSIAIATAYLRLKAANAYPADHWLGVLENDPRMKWTGYEIRYADWTSPLASMFKGLRWDKPQSTSSPRKSISRQDARQVYRFKAMLWHQKRLWRQIEIQGGQTLADLDDLLRTAFEHDHMDHLGGFWKLVRRGQTRRFREIDLGIIYPYGSGEDDASSTRVASLLLSPGQALKYVYDFGDWIEHRLELESISEPEENITYPRITGRNKPRYEYCRACKDKGLKTVAAWICITCSNKEQEDILLCESCTEAHAEDHYLAEILY